MHPQKKSNKNFTINTKTNLTILIVALLLTGTVNAAPWTGSTSVPANDGLVYTISTPEELAWIAEESQTNDFSGKVIRLTADLDMGGTQETPPSWKPIGNETFPFQGELDGNIHVVYNLYITGLLKTAGLIAETGAQAIVHHLALAQGQIFTTNVNDVGSFIGINRGHLHHVFNMAQILADKGNRVGGLVGTNEGSIEYSYNTGIITKAGAYVGGLVGRNNAAGIVRWCFNSGYCKGSSNVGSLFGMNELGATLEHVYFDQQITRMHASGAGENDPSLVNSNHAIESTRDVSNAFQDNPEWHLTSTEANISYPELTCFAGTDVSLISAYYILLDAIKQPTERADGVGMPTKDNERRERFWLCNVTGKNATWSSDNSAVIKIQYGTQGEVYRPCGDQEVMLTAKLGNFTKQIYTQVSGYKTFDAGDLIGSYTACWNEVGVVISKKNEGEVASGGKDDEPDGYKGYTYKLEYYAVTYDENNNEILTYLDTYTMNQKVYKDWSAPTDIPGKYMFKQWVHDYQCNTEFVESEGKFYLTVCKAFDPGELYEGPDTIYGLPADISVLSKIDATGGKEHFNYIWKMEHAVLDTSTQSWVSIEDDTREPLYIGSTKVSTASFDYRITQPGEYTFSRKVSEENCNNIPQEAKNNYRVCVFNRINPGSINAFEHQLCTPVCMDTINELDAVSGGNGLYTYRWLCNGEPIANSDSTSFLLDNFPMENDHTYIFQRQVKDNTGLMDWLTSEGQVSVRVYKEYDAGALEIFEGPVCGTGKTIDKVDIHVRETRAANGEPGSELVYCWLLYRGGTDTVLLDTIHHNSALLDTTLSLSSYSLSTPTTLFLQRAVQNLLCQTEWKLSENTIVWRFGKNETKEIAVNICARDLPYAHVYTYKDGHTQSFLFEQANQNFHLTDETEDGCPLEVTLRSQVTPVPMVETEPFVSLCETAGALKLAFKIREGAPDRFDLTFSQSAKMIGFRDSIDAVLPTSGIIEINVPTQLPLGKHSFTIVFYADVSSSEECKKSVLHTIQFSIDMDGFVHRKENEVIFVDNSGKHNDEGLTFVTYQWYKNGELLEGENGQFYYEYNGLNGFYQVVMTGTDGKEYRSCIYDFRPVTPIEDTDADELCRKIIRNGRLLLIVGDKIYNVMGQEER